RGRLDGERRDHRWRRCGAGRRAAVERHDCGPDTPSVGGIVVADFPAEREVGAELSPGLFGFTGSDVRLAPGGLDRRRWYHDRVNGPIDSCPQTAAASRRPTSLCPN